MNVEAISNYRNIEDNLFFSEPKPDEEKETEKTSGEIVIEEVEKSEKSFPEVEVTNCETDQVQPLQEQEVLIKSAPKLESEILPVIVEEVSDFDSDKLPLWCTPVESINSGPGTNSINGHDLQQHWCRKEFNFFCQTD